VAGSKFKENTTHFRFRLQEVKIPEKEPESNSPVRGLEGRILRRIGGQMDFQDEIK
jgi:hypothetical protein